MSPFGVNIHFDFTDYYLFGGTVVMMAGAYIFKEVKFKNNVIKKDGKKKGIEEEALLSSN